MGYITSVLGNEQLIGNLDLLVALLITSVIVVVIAATKPKRVYLLLFATAIIGSGTMIRHYSIVDEYLMACFYLGTLMYIGMRLGVGLPRRRTRIERLHLFLFLLMAGYLIFQSMRGISELESARKIRWVVFYGMIALLPLTLYAGRFPIPSRRQVALVVAASTLVYFIAYIVSGIIAQNFYGVSRFDLQSHWWASTAYSMLPLAIAMPALFICVTDKSSIFRWLGWSTFVIIGIASLYYDSRVAILALVAFSMAGVPVLGVRRSLGFVSTLIGILAIFVLIIWPSYKTLGFLTSDLSLVVQSTWKAEELAKTGRKDIDRAVYARVSFTSISDEWNTLFFGHGLRTHGQIISPFVREKYMSYGRPDLASTVSEDTGTEAFTALVVDTGVVGLLLILGNFTLVALQIIRNTSDRYRTVIITSVVLLLLWMFVINILDVTLFYLAMMPSGLLMLLSRPSEDPESTKSTSGLPRRSLPKMVNASPDAKPSI